MIDKKLEQDFFNNLEENLKKADKVFKANEKEEKSMNEKEKYEREQLLDELSKMPSQVIAMAYLHAINYTLYGEDVTEKWETAIQNALALENAYKKGYSDALIISREPPYELRWTDKERKLRKLGIDIGDEVVNDFGIKGVVVGIDTYEDEILFSLLMKNYKVPQLVEASIYKTKTGRHFPQITELLEQIKKEED